MLTHEVLSYFYCNISKDLVQIPLMLKVSVESISLSIPKATLLGDSTKRKIEKDKEKTTEGHCSWLREQQPSAELLHWSAPVVGFVRLQTGCAHFLPESSIKREILFRQLYIEPCQSRLFELNLKKNVKYNWQTT